MRPAELTTGSASRLRFMRQQSGLTVTIHKFKFRAFRRDRIHLMPQLQVQIAPKDFGHLQEGVEESQTGRVMLGHAPKCNFSFMEYMAYLDSG